MNTLVGTIKNGQVVLDSPAEFPEGTRVQIMPIAQNTPTLGMREEDWPTTAEGIAALLERMDRVEPDEWLSPEDDAAWRAELKRQRDSEKAHFLQDAERLRGVWE
jgi:hypothetical protein